MTRRSPRELEHVLKRLEGTRQEPGDDGDFHVEWRDAAPEERPEGIEYDPEERTIYYDLWKAQRDTLDTLASEDIDITAFLAGYGSGKTVFGARWLIKQALEYPGSRFLTLGVDFQKARGTTFHTLLSQLPGERTEIVTSGFTGPEASPIVSDYNRQEHRLTLINDTQIILGSADKWSRYAGLEVGGVWMDEPSHYGDELFDLLEMIGARLRGVDGPKTQLWTLTGAGFSAAYYILEQREDKDGDPINLNIDVVRASTTDNPYLSESDIDRFRRQYENTSREEQALHGGFQAAQGLVYPMFSRETHVIPHEEATDRIDGSWRMYGYDAGWRDPRAVLEIGKTDYGQFIAIDEYRETGTHIEEVIHWLKEHEKPRGKIYCEHEPSDVEKLRAAGFHAENAKKSLEPGISEVRKRFEIDDDGRPGFLISDRCEGFIREILDYQEEEVGSSAAEDHLCDCARYAILSERGDRSNWLREWSEQREGT